MVRVIHPLVLAQLPEYKVVLERGDANRISLADGSMENAFDVEQLRRKLGTGKELWSQKMVVADIEASMVIGMNFMGAHQGILDMREKSSHCRAEFISEGQWEIGRIGFV